MQQGIVSIAVLPIINLGNILIIKNLFENYFPKRFKNFISPTRPTSATFNAIGYNGDLVGKEILLKR
jgi:hypothetical protein